MRQQARSLAEAGDEVLLVAGEAGDRQPDPGFPLALIPDLRYDSRRLGEGRNGVGAEASIHTGDIDSGEAERLASSIMFAMERHWGSCADVVHVHNPLIRKNRLLLPALRILQSRGVKLLLQNHDFAEDFRPDVYLSGSSYVDDAHYAAVNGRDHSFLRRAGLAGEGTHLLPNAVVPLSAKEGLRRTRYLYPVRGSRRKNIGEALLLSLFIPEGRTVAVTLPPAASRDAPAYDHWKSLAARLRLPVEFEIGERETLQEAMGSCFCALTTSIKEGFGFSFLEPWTAGRAVIGRRIDYVCRDFEQSGVKFDACYDEVAVPMVYLPAPLLRHKMESALAMTYRSYGIAPPPYALKALTDDLFSRDSFDFGRMDEELQTDVIETVASNAAAREDIADANPFLAGLGSWEPDERTVSANRDKILTAYAPQAAAARLRETYRFTLERPVRHRLSKSVLLELFLDPFKISLIGLGHD
jgi:glycosyltransferase involved in cell wall biosynthesis